MRAKRRIDNRAEAVRMRESLRSMPLRDDLRTLSRDAQGYAEQCDR